jgi:hypothetical protein
MRQNALPTVNRSFIIAAAFALAALPALALAAPTGSQTHPHPAAPTTHAAAPSGSVHEGDLSAPSRFDGAMKPLTMPQHYALHAPATFIPQPISAYPRYAMLPAGGSLWYPSLLTPACAAGFAAAPLNQPPSDFTLGSLVDGKSNLLSAKHGADFAKSNGAAGSDPSPVTLQISSYQPGCGLPQLR